MNAVGNYALVRDVCAALQAGKVVRSDWREVGPYVRMSGRLVFMAFVAPGLTGLTGSVHDDAYEAAAVFVSALAPGAKVRVAA